MQIPSGIGVVFIKFLNSCKMKSSSFYPRNAEQSGLNVFCVPPKRIRDFCLFNYDMFKNPKVQNAANIVISAYQDDDEVHFDYIRIINEFINKF